MSSNGLPFEFTRPDYLWALLLLPLFWAIYRRSLVDLPLRQLAASLIVRSLMVTLLILAVSGLSQRRLTDEVFVVFAVDESVSIGPKGAEVAQTFIKAATENQNDDRFAVLPFASTPVGFLNREEWNERTESVGDDSGSASDSKTSSGQSEVVGRSPQTDWKQGTNLQQVVDVAAAAIPPDKVPHLVLLTDGLETDGDLSSVTTNSKLRLSTVPLPVRDDPEIQVSEVIVPAQVSEGEPFQIEVVVDANRDGRVTVDVFSDDFRVLSEEKDITPGENRFAFTQQVQKPTQFSAAIRPATDATDQFHDTLADNNLASGVVFTSGKPRVLLIEATPEHGRHLEWAMQEEGITVETRPPQGMPDSLADLQNYAAVILSNVPATDLSSRQMEVIRSYVSELGGGFIMLGGDESFGLGGYYKTVIEEVLPVRSDFEKEKEKPGIAMVLVIDKSGSMGGQKLELAKDAAKAAVELLGKKDQIGVIAFDGTPYWVSEIASASRKSMVADRISSIEPGGGTAMYPAMIEALTALQGTTAKLKHVIVMTDGYSTPGDFDGVSQDMAASRITISTVGVGEVDEALLERIAETGRGRYYFTNNPASIPQIFAKETMTATKSAINEEPFLPLVMRATPVLEGINFEEAPFLLGYVVTRPKPTSEVILVTESGDPLLSWWRYGLGMSVAFTSDAKSQWAAEWLSWPGFNTFWAQVIRQCMKRTESGGLNVDVQQRRGQAHVLIDAVNPLGEFLNDAETTVAVIDPTLDRKTVEAPQTAPGTYECTVELNKPGAWYMQVSQKTPSGTVTQQTRGIVVGYNDELRLRPLNEGLLEDIAERTGGRFQPEPASVFDPVPGVQAAASTPLWPLLLSLAAVLLVLDVALRRLDLPRIFGDDRSTDRRLSEIQAGA